MGGEFAGEWIHVYVWLKGEWRKWIHVYVSAIHLKLLQHCLLIGYTPVQKQKSFFFFFFLRGVIEVGTLEKFF